MFDKKLLNTLISVGFTQNSAKAYMALLEEAPLSGYAIALKAGVTRPRIYDALHRLLEQGYIRAKPGKPVTYMPVPMDEIAARQREAETQSVNRAQRALARLEPKNPPLGSIVCVKGYNIIIQSILASIKTASEKIYIYIRKEEYELLEDDLRKAAQRGVQIYGVFAVEDEADIPCEFAADRTYIQRLQSEQSRHGNLWTVITLDNQAGFIGITSRGDDSMAVSTFNPAYVDFLTSNVATYFVERDYMAIEKGASFTSAECSTYATFRRELVHP